MRLRRNHSVTTRNCVEKLTLGGGADENQRVPPLRNSSDRIQKRSIGKRVVILLYCTKFCKVKNVAPLVTNRRAGTGLAYLGC